MTLDSALDALIAAHAPEAWIADNIERNEDAPRSMRAACTLRLAMLAVRPSDLVCDLRAFATVEIA